MNSLTRKSLTELATKNLYQVVIGVIVIALLVLANARVDNIIECLNRFASSPSNTPKIAYPECQSTFLDSETRESLVVCTAKNITFYIDRNELMVFRDHDADLFVQWLRSCFHKVKKTCRTSRIIHPSSSYCVYNSTLQDSVTICFNSIKDPKELRLKDYVFAENQFNLIIEALVFAYKAR